MPRQDDDSSDSQPHPAGDRPVRMRDKSHLGTKNYGQLATWTNTTTVPGTTMSHVSTPSSRLRVVGVDGEGLVERRHATQSRSPSARLAAARSSRSTVPRGCRSPTPFGRANRADGTGHQGGPWSAGSAESPCSGRSSVMVVWLASWCPFVTTASPRLLSPGCCRPAAVARLLDRVRPARRPARPRPPPCPRSGASTRGAVTTRVVLAVARVEQRSAVIRELRVILLVWGLAGWGVGDVG